MGQSPIRVQIQKEMPDLTWPEGKGGNSRRRMASELQLNRLPGLLAIKMILEQISFANRLVHQSTTSTNKWWKWRTQAEHSRLTSGPPLMKRLGIYKNIPVFGTKLALGFDDQWLIIQRLIFGVLVIALGLTGKSLSDLTWQRTNSSQLTWERSRVHRRWASCLRPKACLHWSSNQGVSLLRTRMTLVEKNVQPAAATNAHSKSQQDCQQTICYARADPALHHKLYSN